MTFYVYENWQADDKTVVHCATCRFCNKGKGIGTGTLGQKNGKWHGEFKIFEEARNFAMSLHRINNRFCSFCKPDKQ